MSSSSIFKKQASTPDDSIYLLVPDTGMKFICPFCGKSKGRPKNFQHLHSLVCHIRRWHKPIQAFRPEDVE